MMVYWPLIRRFLPYVAGAALLWGLWYWAYSNGQDDVQAKWDAATVKATEAARVQEGRWQGRIDAAEKGLRDAQSTIAARDADIGVLTDRVRDLATRPRPTTNPAGLTQCVAELASERHRASTLGNLLAEGNDLARDLGRERDDAVARLYSAEAAWPR
jgi:hypothetical protein